MPKSGFVSIIGYPNAGKSTLLNQFIKEQLSIVTYKAQTTRKTILGILTEENCQIIFQDTPGILNTSNLLHECMLNEIKNSLNDVDVVIWIIDSTKNFIITETLKNIIQSIDKKKLIIAFNKCDTNDKIPNDFENIDEYRYLFISAKNNKNIDTLKEEVCKLLPQHDFYYSKDIITEKPERFYASEIIRKHILLNFKKEIPYSVEVVIDKFEEKEKIININAIVYTERKSQKAILIGKNGDSLKQLGVDCRLELEQFFHKHIFLTQYIKVLENWRRNKLLLKSFNYS